MSSKKVSAGNRTSDVKLKFEYQTAQNSAQSFRDRWDNLQNLAYGRLIKTGDFKSHVKEGTLSSLIYERVCRVCAQPPTGSISALTQHDVGKSRLMNLVWTSYVLPNANSQFPSEIKSWMWDYYSLVFGAMPAIHFYRADDEYVGPDWRVLNPRFVYPQAGRLSPADCDYVFVDTFHSVRELEKWRKKETYNREVIDKLMEKAKTDTANNTSSDETTSLAEERGEANDFARGQIRLTTKYERGVKGKWITFDPETGDIVREIPNPYESGRIPVVWKLAQPLIDSFYGLGDVERGESLQRAQDSIVNMYMDGMKMRLLPIIRYDGEINSSQIPFRPGSKWKIPKEADVRTVDITANSSQEFTAGSQFLKGSLLNQNGTTDTTISGDQKFPGYGKSPEALQQLKERENARDNTDRKMLEAAHEELYEGMIEDLTIAAKVEAPAIDFWLFGDDVQQIAEAGYTDILEISDSAIDKYVNPDAVGGNGKHLEMSVDEYNSAPNDEFEPIFNGSDSGGAKISVDQEKLVGKYRYLIDVGSSLATSQKDKTSAVEKLFNLLSSQSGQMILQALSENNKKFNVDVLFSDYMGTIGIQNKAKLITEIPLSESQSMEDSASADEPSQPQNPENPENTIEPTAQDFTPEMIQDAGLRETLIANSQGGLNG